MKISIFIIILLLANIRSVVSVPTCIGRGELIFYNYYADGVTVKVIPYGSVFSGYDVSNWLDHKYSLRPSNRTTNAGTNWIHVAGGSRSLSLLPTGNLDCANNYTGYAVFDWDDGANYFAQNNWQQQVVAGAVSYGLWLVEFWYIPSDDSDPYILNSCWLDYRDWRAPEGCDFYGYNDLFVKLTSDKNIYFYWGNSVSDFETMGWISVTSLNVPNKYIQWYRQIRLVNGVEVIFQCPGSQNMGNFLTSNADGGYWLNFPIDAHALNSNYMHINPELLNMNLSVASGHHAKIKQDKTMYIESGATLNLLSGSTLQFLTNSTLYVKKGGKFCNYGGTIVNSNIRYESRGVYNYCNYFSGPIKGGNLTIEDSAIVEFPDSTTLVFDSTAVFTMMPHSELRMGKHSKIIFQNGSRINCNNAKITSLDSTKTWDGIYLSDDANDTLINCVIQNAYNGINITQPTSIGLTEYSTVINNCTFKNTTNTKLLNQVYIDGSDDILIKDCSTESNLSSGYASCIVMQYCPSGSVVIADNSFSNCDIGITAIQSSPYIARNTITGLTGSGTGLYLDNSNGTIEYNTVNNFDKSIECGYSSPYLLKNSFNNANDIIIQMYSASVPVMRPVNSGTVTRWLGGNNILAGMPGTGAMMLEKESYPMIDSGYNLISVNGYNYISGELDGDLEATMNYWFDSPPVSAYFDVSGGEVNYDPLFNGTSLPAMDYFELNSLGFGMYDSVYVIDNGDNPLAGSLYMQAYTNEMQGNYSTAIAKYKDVVTEYKTSTYATVSLARIFNCLEKNSSSVTDYSNIQSYYSGIKNDTNNTKESREISEDFVIKSKVRQGNIMEAVSDYENIYQNNQNTHKGTHALLNKLCLLKYGAGGDNPNSSSGTESKVNILSLISGKSLSQNISSNTNSTPRSFKLYQNYPNPFNPVTNIKYEIPKDANVSIKVYDLLGREVFSVNEYKQAGIHEVMFDGSNLASGMYFYSLEASPSTGSGRGYFETKKMVLIK